MLVATILMAAVLTFLPATTPTQWIICIIACCCPLGIAFAPVPMSVISFAVVLLLMFTPGYRYRMPAPSFTCSHRWP